MAVGVHVARSAGVSAARAGLEAADWRGHQLEQRLPSSRLGSGESI